MWQKLAPSSLEIKSSINNCSIVLVNSDLYFSITNPVHGTDRDAKTKQS